MHEKVWWKEETVYQIYPRSFCDSDGDGIGDINGIISKLDYLKELGIGVIWLSPVYRSPNADYGYDISDYQSVQPEYGSMDDMQRLIAQAAERGIRIIMDLVLNHTSDEHEWFQKSRMQQDDYKDYYIWKEGRKGGKLPPNNWDSLFGGSAWQYDEKAGKYYLHLFDRKQPDLNWNHPAVYREIRDVMRFWLDKGIAGFRCDVINLIYKTALCDAKKRLALTGKEYYISQPGCHDIIRRLRADILDAYDCFTVGETALATIDMARDFTLPLRRELNMVFGFEHLDADCHLIKWWAKKYRAKNLKTPLIRWQSSLPWNAVYFENHDQCRSISRFGDVGKYRDQSAEMLAGLLFSLRGTPYVYQGEEIGMTNADFESMQDIKDVESHNVYEKLQKFPMTRKKRWRIIRRGTRDNARTPMQWKAGRGAGFTSGTPWLKINDNHCYINVETEEQRSGILNFYRRMIAFRKSENAMLYGDFIPLKSNSDLFAFQRTDGQKTFLIVANMCGEVRKFRQAEGQIRLSNYGREKVSEIFQPYEFLITELREESCNVASLPPAKIESGQAQETETAPI